jgi:hypothetical protein
VELAHLKTQQRFPFIHPIWIFKNVTRKHVDCGEPPHQDGSAGQEGLSTASRGSSAGGQHPFLRKHPQPGYKGTQPLGGTERLA